MCSFLLSHTMFETVFLLNVSRADYIIFFLQISLSAIILWEIWNLLEFERTKKQPRLDFFVGSILFLFAVHLCRLKWAHANIYGKVDNE